MLLAEENICQAGNGTPQTSAKKSQAQGQLTPENNITRQDWETHHSLTMKDIVEKKGEKRTHAEVSPLRLI